MNIWKKCNGPAHVTMIEEGPFRVVESQSTLYSRNLVDTPEEHEILEKMLEASKPKVDIEKHYLISTPFRYPPLKYGSRFGSRFEKSLWYGSLDIETALSEVAYYRLQFLNDTQADLGFINVSLTSFNVKIKTNKGVDLCSPPFNKYEDTISSKTDYTDSQAIGADMREAGIEAFVFRSARSKVKGKNIAAYTQAVFQKKGGNYIFNTETWSCIANKFSVVFSNQNRVKFSF